MAALLWVKWWLARRPSGGTSADGQAADEDRRQANAHGHPLAVLAAVAHARVERHVVADGADLLQGSGAVADQRRALHRGADHAVLHPIRFRAGEDELAVGDVDLAAAEADSIDAVLEFGEHVGRAG